MKLQTVEIEREITVESLLESKGLNPNLYFMSVDGTIASKIQIPIPYMKQDHGFGLRIH